MKRFFVSWLVVGLFLAAPWAWAGDSPKASKVRVSPLFNSTPALGKSAASKGKKSKKRRHAGKKKSRVLNSETRLPQEDVTDQTEVSNQADLKPSLHRR